MNAVGLLGKSLLMHAEKNQEMRKRIVGCNTDSIIETIEILGLE